MYVRSLFLVQSAYWRRRLSGMPTSGWTLLFSASNRSPILEAQPQKILYLLRRQFGVEGGPPRLAAYFIRQPWRWRNRCVHRLLWFACLVTRPADSGTRLLQISFLCRYQVTPICKVVKPIRAHTPTFSGSRRGVCSTAYRYPTNLQPNVFLPSPWESPSPGRNQSPV